MCVLDVDPGIVSGSLCIRPLIQTKIGLRGMRKRPRAQTSFSIPVVIFEDLVTYSPQSASSALNPGRTVGRQLEPAILPSPTATQRQRRDGT